MKISKSKRQLAQLLIEAGVKQLPEGANWVAQDGGDATAYYYTEKPIRDPGSSSYRPTHCLQASVWVDLHNVIPNWHQAALSRAEFDQIVAEGAGQGKPDADGWIEWKGGFYGDMPVAADAEVDILMDGTVYHRYVAECWKHWGSTLKYRLYKPEQVEPQYCESVTPENFAEKIDVERVRNYLATQESEQAATPTLDQLLQDYRNASDFAATKQAEADEAAKMRDEQWKATQARACELGVHISVELVVDAEMRESELVITDWRDLRVGDLIKVTGFSESTETERRAELLNADSCTVVVAEGDDVQIEVTHNSSKCSRGWSLHGFVDTQWRFIRRP